MAAVGLLSSITRGVFAPDPDHGSSAATDRLCSDGNLASVACHPRDRGCDSASPIFLSPRAILKELLEPFHENPDEISHRLLDRFGTIAGVASATAQDLSSLERENENWAAQLVNARQLIFFGFRENAVRTNLSSSRIALLNYLKVVLGGLQHERLMAIFVDDQGMVLAEEVMAEGDGGQVSLPMRRIISRALFHNCSAVLLAHNHPSGIAKPSRSDIRNTLKLDKYMRLIGLHVLDHLIVSQTEIVSLVERGRI